MQHSKSSSSFPPRFVVVLVVVIALYLYWSTNATSPGPDPHGWPSTSRPPIVKRLTTPKAVGGQPEQRDAMTTAMRGFPNLLGVSVCASDRFVHLEGDRIVLSRPLSTFQDAEESMTYRPCYMPGPNRTNSLVSQSSLRQFHDNNGIVAPYAPSYAGSPVENFCLIFKLASACTQGLNRTECEELGGVNVVSRFRAAPSAPSAIAQRPHKAPHFIFFLIDSVSTAAFHDDMPRTRRFLEDNFGDRWVEYEHTSSLGFQSAINHAALFAGAGAVPEKCANFKITREGIPKPKDGESYHIYRKVGDMTLGARLSNHFADFSRSWLRLGHPDAAADGRRLRTVYYPIPQNAWEASCQMLFDEESFYTFGVADVAQWRFFNEAVRTVNRELNGSQGCIGQSHSLDHLLTHVRDALTAADRLGMPATVLLAEQTPHQAEWRKNRAMEYFDRRLEEVLRGLATSGALDNAVLLFAGDHGLGYAVESRAAMLDRVENVLSPLMAWGVGKHVQHGDAFVAGLKQTASLRTSHLDLHATMLSMLQSSPPTILPKKTAVGRRMTPVSLINGAASTTAAATEELTANRSCVEMGVFFHACRFASQRALTPSEQATLLKRIRTLVASINVEIAKYGVPCEQLEAPSALADHTVKLFDKNYISATATFQIKRRDGNRATFRVDTKAERVRGTSEAQLRLRNAVRVSPYKQDELRCGLTLALLGRNMSGSAKVEELNASAGPIDIQFCFCTAAKGPISDVFVGA